MRKGFTLVELLVSIAIFTVITTVAVFNHATFNSSVLLTNLAYEIALSVRQAQFYGIVVRQTAAGAFDSGYGIHFDLAQSSTNYRLFEDKPPQNHVYDSGEDVESFTIQKGNRISRLVVTTLSGTTSKNNVDISFIRPNPDTYIRYDSLAGNRGTKLEICVSSPTGALKRKITVEETGQISVGTDVAVCN